ncbi:MAG: DUF2791 family P-loop domain-containing protein [Proteobacteria bacterium]|nr:DUF2791 family P-loop domain-containing protein [Pseudomonadota bacterium]MBU1648356.1 DUF2791 family P-loop domain-containing protein [Pseudomonadota bacterium]
MTISVGTSVEHLEFGPGKVTELLGTMAIVDFFGEQIDCNINELTLKEEVGPRVIDSHIPASKDKVAFRKAFEAVNLGVVPPDSSSLIEMSIGGENIASTVRSSLDSQSNSGLCKVVFGNYGTGKSHYLHLTSVIARRSGWAVSYLELDLKAVDPAKPHLVYREIMSKLKFPAREDGTASQGFHDFVREIKKNWDKVRDLPMLKASPWFRYGLETLMFFPHNDDPDYVSGCGWLAGQGISITGSGSIRDLAKSTNINSRVIPIMPKTRENAEIYVFHLVVVNEICKALGYKGLLIIMDEAEHVRGYNVRRREKANNFFDLLARAAHLPLQDSSPVLNDHGYQLPEYWTTGPHFGLYVGLTEGETFADDSLSLRDACVFLHNPEDRVCLSEPSAEAYRSWTLNLLTDFHTHYPEKSALLSTETARQKVANALANEFEGTDSRDCVVRTWVKIACLCPSIVLAENADSLEDLIGHLQTAARQLTGSELLPWE